MGNEPYKASVVVAVDPGDVVSGIIVLWDGKIIQTGNTSNAEIWESIYTLKKTGIAGRMKLRVIVEDFVPYMTKSRPEMIETCKYMGELRYRLKTARIAHKFIARSTVKAWAFKEYPEICIPAVDKKIAAKDRRTKAGELWKACNIYVDDPIIVSCMRKEWNIPVNPPERRFEPNRYGITKHSWQALALATYYLKCGQALVGNKKATTD